MTYQQEQAIIKTREKIGEIRNMLDDVMYRTESLDDRTIMRIRDAYDYVCKANDILP